VVLLVLVMAPFWTSQLLRYYAWIMLLGAKGIPNWLSWIGIKDVPIINTQWAVLIGAVYGFLPLMVPPIYVSLEKLDKRLLEASADLGATPMRTFLQVTLPLALPGVHSAYGRLHLAAVSGRQKSLFSSAMRLVTCSCNRATGPLARRCLWRLSPSCLSPFTFTCTLCCRRPTHGRRRWYSPCAYTLRCSIFSCTRPLL
jgi:Binding-protein-dependent transport system inner membrane component